MNGYFTSAAGFLIESVFSLYIFAVLLRFMLQLVRADFYNPVSQFLVKITNPPLKPLRRVIPGLWGIDLASVFLLLVLTMLKIFLLGIVTGNFLAIPGLLVLSISDLIGAVLNIYFVSILAQVILSWVGPGTYNPLTSILYAINEPLMAPARRLLPPLSGIDLSPIIVFLGIGLLKILLVSPLRDVGMSLT